MINANNSRVEICGVNTENLKTIPEKLKIELIKKAQSGDKNARNQMIESNLKLVLSVVQKFSNRAKSLDDIFQIGTIGLIKAVDNFDISQNTKFSTYAVPMIIGEIRRYMRDNTQIRVSRSMRETAYKAIKIREYIFNATGKEPTIDEIAEKLGISRENISIALESISDPVSLSEPVFTGFNTDENLTLIDQISEESDESWLEEILIKEQIKNLNKKEKLILSLRFLSGLTQTKVAKKLNISQAQVSRIEKNAIKKIRSKN
ncbi:MAG: SigB/SigF/SigG family RNA polymerase sigma factor [Clostridia bacterium]|nr:SigB/SigF/SigG family RNA polymerase sigma factor [Clostridia bacterium]